MARDTHLVYFSETRDIWFIDTSIVNVTNDTPSKILIIDKFFR